MYGHVSPVRKQRPPPDLDPVRKRLGEQGHDRPVCRTRTVDPAPAVSARAAMPPVTEQFFSFLPSPGSALGFHALLHPGHHDDARRKHEGCEDDEDLIHERTGLLGGPVPSLRRGS